MTGRSALVSKHSMKVAWSKNGCDSLSIRVSFSKLNLKLNLKDKL